MLGENLIKDVLSEYNQLEPLDYDNYTSPDDGGDYSNDDADDSDSES